MKQIKRGDGNGLDSLIPVDVEPRPPSAGEVQVRVHASSLNYHDYVVAIGTLPTEPGRVPLSDAAGEITAIGEGVDRFAVGDRVMSHFFPNWIDGPPALEKLIGVPGDHVDGFASQVVTMPAQVFSPMPSHLDFAEAATLPCAALTAWRAVVEEASLAEGDWVLVQGSGGVSIFALQIAKKLGCRVIATSSSEEKMARLKNLGADEVINYREEARWGRRATEVSGGGVALVVEVGGPDSMRQSVRSLRIGGAIAMIGNLTGNSGDVPLADFFQRNAHMAGITVGSHEHQRRMAQAFEEWELRPVVDSHFPLVELADAFRYQESQRHFGKIAVEIA